MGRLIGITGEADDPGKEKQGNTKIICDPLRGANPGFFRWVVGTHNGCGVSAGGELTLPYGEVYDFSVAKVVGSEPVQQNIHQFLAPIALPPVTESPKILPNIEPIARPPPVTESPKAVRIA